MSDILDQLIIETEDEMTKAKAGHTRKVQGKKIRVRSSVEVAKDNYKLAKRTHKAEIKKLKAQMRLDIKIARNNIKAHRNLIASAKTTYKAIKLRERK
ncbi:MAG TPA: hypothetical protein VN081_04460 [Dongiaceae bacterium]|nr:hypothetical protein [Dongiaceae bacterium]